MGASVLVLPPSPADLWILLVDRKLEILEMPLHLVGKEQAGGSCAHTDDLDMTLLVNGTA